MTSKNDVFPALVVWTLYDHPSDFPNHIVARAHAIGRGGQPLISDTVVKGQTVDEVRAKIPPGLVRFPRSDHDEKQIIESWM